MIAALIVISIIFAIVVYIVIAKALVFTYMWAWFIMPFSESIPEVSLSWAIGLSMFVTYLTYELDTHKDEREIDKGRLVVVFIAPWITLALAAAVHAIMT